MSQGEDIGHLALRKGLITPQQLNEALAEQSVQGLPIEAILIRKRYLTSEQLATLLRTQTYGEDLAPGSGFGKFRLVRILGKGAAGTVWLAEDQQLGRQIALKLLLRVSRDELQRFTREARLAAKLTHPNIVQVYEMGEIDGRPYISMQYIDGAPPPSTGLPTRRALELMCQLAKAVHHAHLQGVIHRDIKPGNILIDTDGKPYLTDFGLAKGVESAELATSQTGAILGTPAYMSPEMARGYVHQVGPRSDVYSLGATLYALLCGHDPFEARTLFEVLNKVANADPPPLTNVAADVRTIVAKAMDKNPARRYASAAEFAEDLGRVLEGKPILARAPSLSYRAKRYILRHRTLIPTVVLTVLVALATGALASKFLRDRAFDRSRSEALKAFAARDWPRALAECGQALDLRPDPELARIADECRRRLRQAQDLARRLKPIEAAIRETWPFFYIRDYDIRTRLAGVEKMLLELNELANANPEYPDPWATLGIGWFFLGDAPRAETALQRAHQLAPDDGTTSYYLARLYIERAIGVLLNLTNHRGAERRRIAKEHFAHAAELFKRSARHWTGTSELDRLIAQGYLALAEGNDRQLREIVRQGLDQFGNELGSEEFWLLQACISDDPQRIQFCSRAIDRRPHYPWAYLLRASSLFRLKDLDGALADYDAAIRSNPRLVAAYYSRATVRKQKGDVDGAMADCQQAIALDPTCAPAFLNRATVHTAKKDDAAAVADCTEAIRLAPDFTDAYCNRAAAYHKLGERQKAIQDYSTVLIRDPSHGHAYAERAVLRYQDGDLPGALADLQEAVRHDPDDALIYVHRGNIRYLLGEAESALADYTKAISLDPQLASAWANRGIVRKRLGQVREALSDLDTAIRLDPTSATAYASRGALRMELNDLPGAMEDYSASLKYAPNNAEAIAGQAQVLALQGKFEEALARFDAAIKADPGCAKAFAVRAQFFSNRGDPDHALADYTEAIRLDPKFLEAYVNRGRIYLTRGDLKAALADYDLAVQLNPRSPHAYYGRGIVKARLNDQAAAIADFDRAITLAPNNPDPYSARGQAKLLRQDFDGAVKDLTRALELAPPDWPYRELTKRLLREASRKSEY